MLDLPQNREEVIKENMLLVHSICQRFKGRGIEYDDLYQAGCMGLVKAVDAFDSGKGFAFSTYAVPVIMGEVRRLFRDGGAVKVSRSVKELYLKVIREKTVLEQKLCREPTVLEIAESLGVCVEEVTQAVCAGQTPLSLTTNNDGEVKEFDLPSVSFEEDVSNKILLSQAFKHLNDTETQILKHRYYNGFTQSKTAKLLSMSQVQVSRSEKKILLKLKSILK